MSEKLLASKAANGAKRLLSEGEPGRNAGALRATTSTERSKAKRSRDRSGLVPLQIDVDEVAVSEFMILGGWLPCNQADNRKALRKALGSWIAAASSPAAYEESATALRRAFAEAGMVNRA
ncbi:hypothetical protein FJ960_01935 [Mesorhizobium sp. B2-3-11]|uniref:hypothetical protein n=1 Tax=Mesorhizobium sp. B2-3-11 TaxID=2589953 RepID=UPI00112AD084|nr:hypothetical protein [Mesorhizobium sp. B2-3-11]TPM11527.1 hypothetical protein FJ960_01935 [Mesorhizobium sp. B2-3-11]